MSIATFYTLVVSRWLHFASLAILFGSPLFLLAVGREDLKASRRATLRLLRLAAPLAAASGLVWVLATIANMAGAPAGLVDPQLLHALFLETPFGPVIIARLVLLAVACALPVSPMHTGPRLVWLGGVAGLLWISQAWLGHAATGGDTPEGVAMIVSYACHVLAAAAWAGGLPPLLFALQETGADDARRSRLLHRASNVATGAVAVILVSGLVNTALRVGAPTSGLFAAAYWHVLLVKLGLVAAMLVLAVYNRSVVTGASRRGLRASVAMELTLGIAVFAAAAVLGITPPPH